ncbi:hypothetical protein NUW58_g6490 [Xylaria curta]|uniref:Uncharacterized protein n=1 Tax=Xylaria curta TaxID=42375 RepID=A0ACC1NTH8_9PEZI|nr:hypothetical protein NUW58_g6490 [Xylaria curta]
MDETHILLGPDVAIQKSKLGRPQQESIAQLEGESELWSCVRSLTDVGSRCSPQNLQVQEGLIPELKKLKIGETKRGHPADILGLVAGNKIDRERGVGKGSGSTNHGRVSQKKSHSTSHCALGHSKRAETSHHGRRGRDGEGEDRRRIKPRSGPARRRLTFACPFYLHNKEAHRGCLNYELKRIVDVRQHIYRSHVQSSYCSRCGIEFQDDHNYSQRDAHITEGNCAVNSNIPLHTGATSDQLGNMSNPATHGRGANDEERWYSIWRIMFPGDDDPPSPYIDVNREWTCIEINAAIIRFRQNGGIQDFVSGLSLEDGGLL